MRRWFRCIGELDVHDERCAVEQRLQCIGVALRFSAEWNGEADSLHIISSTRYQGTWDPEDTLSCGQFFVKWLDKRHQPGAPVNAGELKNANRLAYSQVPARLAPRPNNNR
jgi:hypothetical protein